MKMSESALRKITRSIIKELLTKKNPFSTQNMLDPEGRGDRPGAIGYDDISFDDGWADDGGDFGEADDKLEKDLNSDEEEAR